jgi:sterol desaturase/sphingolipid hydroxylase (fatty acid hydroxylase superfamily)
MHEKVITWATPVFFALIALELAWGWRSGRNPYRTNDAITSIGLGAMSQVSGVFTRLFRIGIYTWLAGHVALAQWPPHAWWTLPAALVFYDFCYYWHHRWMHEIGVAWAAHVVHHSSEDYNLSAALRQSSTGALLGWIPYVPMAVAGVPPEAFAMVALIDLLYQYWIHTELVGRLGWFDRVFASPSNHRVHHAVNDVYIDRNYGGILIVWDRLFGTFQDELAQEPPVYGTRAPLRSFNPVWANLEVYAALARDAWRTRRWVDKLQVWVRRPGWRPADVAAAEPRAPFSLARRQRFDPAVPAAVRRYALFQFAIVLGFTVHFLQMQRTAPTAEVAGYLAFIAAALVGIGGLLEARRGFVVVEIARHAAMAALVLAAGRWFGTEALAAGAQAAFVGIATASALGAWRAARALRPAARDGLQAA